MSRPSRSTLQRLGLGALSLGIVVATFAFVLPTIADYRDVWALVQDLSWEWIALLCAATLVNLLTFAPPWMIALPGLSFGQAITVTQVSTALSIVVPGGLAAGVATSYAMLRRWGFVVARGRSCGDADGPLEPVRQPGVPDRRRSSCSTAKGVTRSCSASWPSSASPCSASSWPALAVVLVSKRLAGDIGDLAAGVADWLLGKIRRGPVSWGGPSFERFRLSAGDLLKRRWHVLTLASLVGSLSVFAVLLVALRAFDVTAAQVSLAEAFAAWSFVRIIGTIPITPGGIGIIEVGLTSALIGFGGSNAGVVAAVLVFRFLTIVPTLVVGLVSAATWRRFMVRGDARAGAGRRSAASDHPLWMM